MIAFAGQAHTLSPLEELYKFYPPKLPLGDGTALGKALDFLMQEIEHSVQKTTLETKGDWKPIIFLFTDGVPTDNPQAAIDKWNKQYRNRCNLVVVSLGMGSDTQLLSKLTPHVLRLRECSPDTFKEFFKWVTASVKTSSVSLTSSGEDELRLAPVKGINLEKVDPNTKCQHIEEFITLFVKCCQKKNDFLIKYQNKARQDLRSTGAQNSQYILLGAYPIDSAL